MIVCESCDREAILRLCLAFASLFVMNYPGGTLVQVFFSDKDGYMDEEKGKCAVIHGKKLADTRLD